MESPPLLKKDWVLTPAAFDRMLAQLDPDRDRAGEKYEQVRQKLTKFFKWRGCVSPEEYTDRTIDRVARKIEEGAELRVKDPYLYFHGVAINVLREHWKEPEREVETIEDLAPAHSPAEDPVQLEEERQERLSAEQRLECLDDCVHHLPPRNVELITRYHQAEEGGAKIKRRKELAEQLGIPLNALRIRAHRIRTELEACIGECLRRSTA